MEIKFATFLGDSAFQIEDVDAAGWQKVSAGDVKIGMIHHDGELAVYVEEEPEPTWEHAHHRPLLLQQVRAFLRDYDARVASALVSPTTP